MRAQIAPPKPRRNILVCLLALAILPPTGACNRISPAAKARVVTYVKTHADDAGTHADELGAIVAGEVDNMSLSPEFRGKLADWAEGSRVDRSTLHESICEALAGARFEDPSGVAGNVVGELISDGIEDKDAREISNELIGWILGQEISFSDWHNANC